MPKIEKPSPTIKPQRRIYSELELKAIDTDITTHFMRVYKLSNGTEVRTIDFEKYHVSKGSMSPEGGVIIECDQFGDPFPPKYELVEERIRQWKAWKFKREYGIKKNLEDLQKIAEQMTVKKEL